MAHPADIDCTQDTTNRREDNVLSIAIGVAASVWAVIIVGGLLEGMDDLTRQ